jgi:hypothetical protein
MRGPAKNEVDNLGSLINGVKGFTSNAKEADGELIRDVLTPLPCEINHVRDRSKSQPQIDRAAFAGQVSLSLRHGALLRAYQQFRVMFFRDASD